MPDSVVYGIYGTRSGVEGAIDSLRRFGFRNTDVSVLLSEKRISQDFAIDRLTRARDGTGAFGWLAGWGLLVIPGAGSFLAAGPVMALLAGARSGGAANGVVGALTSSGIPEFEARRCQRLIEGGDILVVVHCGSAKWVRCTGQVFRNTGAGDIAWSGAASAPFLSMHGPTWGRGFHH